MNNFQAVAAGRNIKDSNVGDVLLSKRYYLLLRLVLFLFNHLMILSLYHKGYKLAVFDKEIMDTLWMNAHNQR